MSENGQERRRIRRVHANLGLKIQYNGKTYKGDTIDVSELGASCTLDLAIPIFDSMQVCLTAPLSDDGSSENSASLETNAIVVSCRKQSHQDSYRVGFYYDELPSSERERVKDWIHKVRSLHRRGLSES
ncbi:MAG: PilZ domain-containing protein [Candidatus Theseobacter exili]|nr:PilZ domain-containing protein [Candidatus Theseobacter exili]